MAKSAVDLLMHPVRIRIVNAMTGGRALTTGQLCERLPNTSQASVYRHVAALAHGGILEVEGEQQVRGAIERRYRLRRDRAAIAASAGKAMSLDEHRRLFTAAMAALIAEFEGYLSRDDADPFGDSVSYRQTVLWLSDTELAQLVQDVRRILTVRGAFAPTATRAPYVLSAILFPAAEPADSAGVGTPAKPATTSGPATTAGPSRSAGVRRPARVRGARRGR